jgi:ribosome-binding protein aMBF1 (putative translation factor)
MDKCYLCGIEDGKTLLYEGIHKKFGIVKVCRKCYHRDKIPLIQKKDLNIDEIDRQESVRERLSRMAHVNVFKKETRKIEPTQEDIHLQNLIEKNVRKEIEEGPKTFDDLVNHFNWVIMRKRRSMKLTRTAFADAIKEQPIVIEALEEGNLPKNYVPLIKKVENYLGVKLLKRVAPIQPEEFVNESKVPSGTLIEDLKNKTPERKNWFFGKKKTEEVEEGVLNPEEISLEKIEEISGKPEKKENKNLETSKKSLNELNGDEINDLIWGKK